MSLKEPFVLGTKNINLLIITFHVNLENKDKSEKNKYGLHTQFHSFIRVSITK